MFILMNETRLNVGVQAFAVAQGAYDASLAYARERLQMRSSSGPKRPDLPADPIIHHADVRRMLLTQKAHIEGGRMLAYWMALCSDVESEHPDPVRRQDAVDLLALLTPVAKAFLSDNAFDDANLALQILGGHGYLRDHGIEQRVRDIRITQIYEGTNGIQARDLLSRKILGDGGARFSKLIHRIRSFVSDHSGPEIASLSTAVGRLCNEVESVVQIIGRAHLADREAAESAAYDVLHALGHLSFGYLFARAATIAAPLVSDADPFYESKMETARFYIAQLMPRAYAHLAAASSAVQHPTFLSEGRLFP